MAASHCDTSSYLKTLQEGVNAFRRLAGEQPLTILKNRFLHKSFWRILLIVKRFERNIMTIFCKFLLKRFILTIVISNVIIKCHWHNIFYGRYMWESNQKIDDDQLL